MSKPLADKIRPIKLDDIVGQKHLLGSNKPLRKIIENDYIPNLIFYGPSGTGKTTLAKIIAEKTHKSLHILNGTSASIADIKQIISEIGTFSGSNGILLYLDEIQYLNKKQQQSLLEYIENGDITLIASTTENPYFAIFNAILSRSTVFEFKIVEREEIYKAIVRAYEYLENEKKVKINIEDAVIDKISAGCGGDVRKAINTVELSFFTANYITESILEINEETVNTLIQKSSMRYDRDGDMHYDIISALQKSIRGSDENAALHYTARLIEAGDIISLSRRLLVIVAEDIGLAYPNAIAVVKACVDTAIQLGFPEARIPLAEAVIFMCTLPKSNTAISAIDLALEDIRKVSDYSIPKHLKDSHYSGANDLGNGRGYKYPHSYPNSYINQQYLPDEIKNKSISELTPNEMATVYAKADAEAFTKTKTYQIV